MDEERARALLNEERASVEALLRETTAAADEDRTSEDEQPAEWDDPASELTDELRDDAVAAQLRARLDAIARAERRLDEGTYGRSVRSGEPIPDDRLEADPAAELTVEEAQVDVLVEADPAAAELAVEEGRED
jgi:DnaK suppressor protein